MADNWIIVNPGGQRLMTEINPSGTGFHQVWEVHYQVTGGPAKGTGGFVRIPASQYTADAVRVAVEAAVQQLNEVAAL